MNKTIILAWTHKTSNLETTDIENFWGLGDIIRGTIKMYFLSKKMNFNLIVDIQNHPISQFLKIQTHEYSNLILENKNNIEFIFPGNVETYINNNNRNILFFFTNDHYTQDITNDCKDFIKNLLTPNDEFKIFFDNKIKELPFKIFNIIHFRLGDGEMVRNENISMSLFDINYNNLINNHDENDVLISDSIHFKKYIKDKIDIFMFDTKVGHFGFHKDDKLLKDTLFEFFIISKATKIKSFSVYSWKSGFVKIISEIYNIPIVT
uniref:Uncharacterized protein n=1 Tax=viral metagenome TaxID=1070528 RepID=A0A6C0DFT3_9ZZZZ